MIASCVQPPLHPHHPVSSLSALRVSPLQETPLLPQVLWAVDDRGTFRGSIIIKTSAHAVEILKNKQKINVARGLTGSRTMNATAVENAAMVNTARKAIAYESRAALCVSGGNVATRVAE